jgi:putative MATE family efflux protein
VRVSVPGSEMRAAAAAESVSEGLPAAGEVLAASVRAPALGVWQLAWPAVLTNLLHATVGFVDLKIVGALGPPAVAAVGTGNRVLFILQATLMAVTAGTTALVARSWGAGDRAEAERVTRASLQLCMGLSLVMTLLGVVFADALAGMFRLDAETVALAATFIRWISVFHVVFTVNFVLGTALRAAGDTRTPLWIGAITNGFNVLLVWALVYGRLGLPRLGVAGAAIASGTAFGVGALLLGGLWWSHRLVLHPARGPCMQRTRIRRLVRIGLPAGMEQVVWQSGFLAFLWLVALYGTAPYAAYQIGVSILSFSFVVGFGFAIAASTLVGQHLGARDRAGAARSGWRALLLSVAVMVVLSIGIIAAAEPLARFMIDDPEVIRLTVVFIYVLGAAQPLMAVEFALGGALRGAGDTRTPLYALMAGLLGARVLLSALFAWLGLAVEWIYAALIADYVLKAFILTRRFRSGRWAEIVV